MMTRFWTFGALASKVVLLSTSCLSNLVSASSDNTATSAFTTGGIYVENATSVCSDLVSQLSIPNVTVYFTSFVPAGTNLTFDTTGNLSTCSPSYQVVYTDICRVAMKVDTSPISQISLEAWLPTNWTGRFLSTGNGGTNGCIGYSTMAYTSSLGFASVGANNGHNGTSGGAFFHNDETVADFAYRSLHTGVVVGKQVTESFYGEAHTKSYYLGCSTGGRQGFKEVQDFPDDFDGVVAGAPALSFNNLTSWSGHFYPITGSANSSAFVPLAMWPVIHAEVMNQCDGLDGVIDGIIEDPDLCRFRPEALQCAPGNTTNCLTGAQVVTVRELLADYYGVDGALIYPRIQPGAEITDAFVYYSGSSFQYTDDWFRYVIYENESWDPSTLSVQDAAYAYRKNPSNIQTWSGDLSSFSNAGGKVLHYHGLADPIISSDNSPLYYNHVSSTMSLPSSSLDDFYRFFRISGMGHCNGGAGAWQIGQTIVDQENLEPERNVLVAVVEWVENGVAPEVILGTKYVNDTQSLGVDFQRRHCRYPRRNVCIDPENHLLPESWECV